MDGVEYESSRVRLVRRSSAFKGPAESVVRRYPEASPVVAHVNPTDHREAVLETGAQPFAALLFVVGGLLMIIVGVLRLLALADAAESGPTPPTEARSSAWTCRRRRLRRQLEIHAREI